MCVGRPLDFSAEREDSQPTLGEPAGSSMEMDPAILHPYLNKLDATSASGSAFAVVRNQVNGWLLLARKPSCLLSLVCVRLVVPGLAKRPSWRRCSRQRACLRNTLILGGGHSCDSEDV